jgi:hypothetical protein
MKELSENHINKRLMEISNLNLRQDWKDKEISFYLTKSTNLNNKTFKLLHISGIYRSKPFANFGGKEKPLCLSSV